MCLGAQGNPPKLEAITFPTQTIENWKAIAFRPSNHSKLEADRFPTPTIRKTGKAIAFRVRNNRLAV